MAFDDLEALLRPHHAKDQCGQDQECDCDHVGCFGSVGWFVRLRRVGQIKAKARCYATVARELSDFVLAQVRQTARIPLNPRAA